MGRDELEFRKKTVDFGKPRQVKVAKKGRWSCFRRKVNTTLVTCACQELSTTRSHSAGMRGNLTVERKDGAPLTRLWSVEDAVNRIRAGQAVRTFRGYSE